MQKSGKNRVSALVRATVVAWLVALAMAPGTASGQTSPPLERPRIQDQTLVSGLGTRLRGGTFWLYGWIADKTQWALSDGPWEAMRANRLSAVRLACAYRPEHADNYSLDEYETILDEVIARAETEGIYAVIDYHPTPGTYNMDDARAFWSRFADRYKDRSNVIFELTNEPVFDQPASYTEANLADFEELWTLCDGLAPDTPIIILTFNQVGYSGAYPADVTDLLSETIDWTKTAVGFHSYWRDSSERIVDLQGRYPCIDTEFMELTPGSNEMKEMDGYAHHGTLMERLGISWLQWDILDREDKLPNLEVVIQDLRDQGYYWEDEPTETPGDGGAGGAPPGGGGAGGAPPDTGGTAGAQPTAGAGGVSQGGSAAGALPTGGAGGTAGGAAETGQGGSPPPTGGTSGAGAASGAGATPDPGTTGGTAGGAVEMPAGSGPTAVAGSGATGGASSASGTAGDSQSQTAGALGAAEDDEEQSEGCGCRTSGSSGRNWPQVGWLLLAGLALRRRAEIHRGGRVHRHPTNPRTQG